MRALVVGDWCAPSTTGHLLTSAAAYKIGLEPSGFTSYFALEHAPSNVIQATAINRSMLPSPGMKVSLNPEHAVEQAIVSIRKKLRIDGGSKRADHPSPFSARAR